jgi:hypothetical protein
MNRKIRESLRLLGMFMIFGGLVSSCMAYVIPTEHDKLRQERLSSIGEVVKVKYDPGPPNFKSKWYIKVKFVDLQGEQHQFTDSTIHPTKLGETGEVLYRENNPKDALFLGKDIRWGDENILTGGLGVAIMGFLLMFGLYQKEDSVG